MDSRGLVYHVQGPLGTSRRKNASFRRYSKPGPRSAAGRIRTFQARCLQVPVIFHSPQWPHFVRNIPSGGPRQVNSCHVYYSAKRLDTRRDAATVKEQNWCPASRGAPAGGNDHRKCSCSLGKSPPLPNLQSKDTAYKHSKYNDFPRVAFDPDNLVRQQSGPGQSNYRMTVCAPASGLRAKLGSFPVSRRRRQARPLGPEIPLSVSRYFRRTVHQFKPIAQETFPKFGWDCNAAVKLPARAEPERTGRAETWRSL